jgi:hypothetical protein
MPHSVSLPFDGEVLREGPSHRVIGERPAKHTVVSAVAAEGVDGPAVLRVEQ